jgi:hypothetical protein
VIDLYDWPSVGSLAPIVLKKVGCKSFG